MSTESFETNIPEKTVIPHANIVLAKRVFNIQEKTHKRRHFLYILRIKRGLRKKSNDNIGVRVIHRVFTLY